MTFRKSRSFISVLIALLLALQMPVVNMQSENVTWKQTGEKEVTISGKADYGTKVSINVLPSGKTYGDLADAADPASVVVYQDDTVASSKNSFSFTVGFEQCGEYTAYVRIGKQPVVTLAILCSKDYVTPENEYILYADFEGRTAEEHGLTVGSADNSVTYEQYDEEHGTSMRVHTWKGSVVSKEFDKIYQDERIAIQYSYLREDDTALQYVRFMNSNENVYQTLYSEGGKAAVFPNIRQWTRQTDEGLIASENVGGWNDALIIVDFLHAEITYAINGNHIQTIPATDITNLTYFAWCANAGSVTWLDDIRVFELDSADAEGITESCVSPELWAELSRPFDVDIESGRIGNIFSGSDTPAFDITYTEREEIADNVTVAYTVYDEYNNLVWSGSDSFTIGAEGSVTRRLVPPVTRYDLYRLEVSVTSQSHGDYDTFTQFSWANTPPIGSSNESFGLNLHYRVGRRYEQLLEITDLVGAGVVRDGLGYGYITIDEKGEAIVPDYDIAYWKELERRGMKFVFSLNDGISAYEYGSEGYCELYKEWATAIVNELNEYGLDFVIETTNEWNHNDLYTSQQYFPVLKAAYEGVKAADEEVPVVGGSVAHVYPHQLDPLFTLMEGEKYMDAFSIHIYTNETHHGPEAHLQEEMTMRARTLLDKYGYTDIPVWLTETGWTSSTNWVSEHTQAAYVARTAAVQAATDWWDVVTWYDLINDGTLSTENEHNFGIVEYSMGSWEHPEPFAAKPAFLALANYNAMTYDAEYAETLSLGDGVYAYRFAKESGKNLIFLTAETDTTVTVSLGVTTARVYDLYGNGVTYSTAGGDLVLSAGADPVYIEYGSASNTVLAEDYVKEQYLKETTGFEEGETFWDTEENATVKTDVANYGTVLTPAADEMILTKEVGAYHKNEGVLTISFDKQESTGENHEMLLGIYEEEYGGEVTPVVSQATKTSGFTHIGIGEAGGDLWNANSRSASTSGAWKHYDIVLDLVEGMTEVYYDGKLALSAAQPIDSIYGIYFTASNANTSQKYYFDNFKLYWTPNVVVDGAVTKDGTSVTLASQITAGDTLAATAQITNRDGFAKPYTLVYAISQNGRLVKTDYMTETVGAGETVKPELPFTVKDTEGLSVKVMVWEGISSMKPYVGSFLVE